MNTQGYGRAIPDPVTAAWLLVIAQAQREHDVKYAALYGRCCK